MALIKGGVLLRNSRAPDNCGTLACLVQSRDDLKTRYLLSAGHVIGMNGHANHGDSIEAQAPGETQWRKVGEFETAVKFRDAEGVLQICDAAIARLTNESLVSAEIDGIGMPREVATGLFEGMNLRFRGAGTGKPANAVVHSTGNVVPVTYRDIVSQGTFTLNFAKQILYGLRSGDVWDAVTKPMDSGALVVNENNLAVGLHIARTSDDYPVNASVCTPLRLVLDALQVNLVTQPEGAAAAAPVQASQDSDALGERSFALFEVSLRSLMEPHNRFGGEQWQLSRDGVIVSGKLDRSPGRLVTVPRVWEAFGSLIAESAEKYKVPIELILATICTESSGRPDALRIEPGWQSDELTPDKVSAGLMQTLISTARWSMSEPPIDRSSLFDPGKSIAAGTAYIGIQRTDTHFDPPMVACAYNAGGLYLNSGAANRWKMRQYPIGTGAHADRFVQWFNDCFAYFRAQPEQLPERAPSFCRLFGEA